jgi:hypothetical protein
MEVPVDTHGHDWPREHLLAVGLLSASVGGKYVCAGVAQLALTMPSDLQLLGQTQDHHPFASVHLDSQNTPNIKIMLAKS